MVIWRVERVWQVWHVLLPPREPVGTWARVVSGAGFPCWHWRVGDERLWTVVKAVLADWRQYRTLVGGFVDVE